MRHPINLHQLAILTLCIGCSMASVLATAPATSPMNDPQQRIKDLEQRVAELEMANRALLRQLAELQAHSSATQQAQNGSLRGAIWLTKVSGDNQALAGHAVFLLPVNISSSRPKALLEKTRKSRVDSIETCKKEIIKIQQSSQKVDLMKSNADLIKEKQAWVKEFQDDVVTIDAALAGMTDQIEFMKFYGTMKSVITMPQLEEIAKAVAIRSIESNRDGQYSFVDVPPGDYVVYAEEDQVVQHGYYFDWVIPIRIEAGKEGTLDLHNKKATAAWKKQ